jgi:hypothetical protein
MKSELPVLAATCLVLFPERTASILQHNYIAFCSHYASERLTLNAVGRELLSWEHSSTPELKRSYHANVLLFRFYWQLQQQTVFVVTQAQNPTY